MDQQEWARRVEQVWEAVAAYHDVGESARQRVRVLTQQPDVYTPLIRGQVALLARRGWDHGWTPHDQVRHLEATLRGVASMDAVAAAACALVVKRARRVVETEAVDPRWAAAVDDAAAFTATLGARAAPGVLHWLAVLVLLKDLPPLVEVVPPPGSTHRASHSCGSAPPRSGATSTDERQLERVRALLAKAESTTFPEEAEALTAKAQELIARYSLERALQSPNESAGDQPAAIRLWLDDPYADAKAALLHRVAGANRCRSVDTRTTTCTTVFGFRRELDAVELLFTSLLAQATAAMARHGSVKDSSGRSRTRSFRRAFMFGFANRVGERLHAACAAQERQVDTESGGALVPVLADRAERVDAAMHAAFPHLARIRSSTITNATGWHAGRTAADLAHLGPSTSALRAG